MKSWQAELCIFSAATIGAITYPIAQWTLGQMDLLLFHIIRFPLLALIFLPVALHRKPDWRRLWQAALPGLFMWLGIVAWSYGIMITDQLGSVAFIIALMSIIAPFLARIIFGTPLQKSTLIGLLIATVGLALLTLKDGLHISEASRWMLLCAFMQGLYLVTNSRYSSRFDPIVMSWAQFVTCGLMSLAVAPFLGHWNLAPSAGLFAALFYMIFISTGLRFVLMTYGQGKTSADRAAVLVLIEPVFAALIAVVVLGETMSAQQWLGAALILVTVYAARPKPKVAEQTPV